MRTAKHEIVLHNIEDPNVPASNAKDFDTRCVLSRLHDQMHQPGSIDAGHCIDVPNTYISSMPETTKTLIARQVSLTLFTGRNFGNPCIC